MGCACISQKEIVKPKDVDISWDITKPSIKETNDSINFKNKIIEEPLQAKKVKSIDLIKIKEDKNIFNEKDIKKNNNKNEKVFSGPIITMLKRQVENYKKIKVV